MKIKEVYLFYQDFVKPIYSEIEAKDNKIPIELLFETYASFDHIKRFYLDNEEETVSSQKAISHLKRGVLDAFKLKLKYFNGDIKTFLSLDIDYQLIDNGNFMNSFFKDKQKIISIAKKARLTESRESKEKRMTVWIVILSGLLIGAVYGIIQSNSSVSDELAVSSTTGIYIH
jgi:hypothetical protein